ncbi:hypothetical protein MIND_00702600 [Mycena indigotica]|uniref:Uncharacterized protein n=1 Tax=Mycena indigotica TaxID=2126181 RepID=A0A8H6W6R7_9AGAR|nr:uncharacterized protein MIND_00702600 [Mycena indigotica]KAF7301374.1 hypothetical protein MIND_00702600 [Mycena indigotica]
MGQSHQIFLVARVVAHGANAARYRCVGAYHHQWCVVLWQVRSHQLEDTFYVHSSFKRLPLMGARSFLDLLKQKDNAKIVQAEIDAIQGQYGKDTLKLPRRAKYIPCPYSLFLAASAFCVDLKNRYPYTSGLTFNHAILDARMGSSVGGTNDGITVFDITSSADPAYCHVSVGGLEASYGEGASIESWVKHIRSVSVSIESFSRNTENLEALERDVQAKIDALRGERLMTIDVLAEAWPKEYRVQTLPIETTDEQAKPRQPFPALVDSNFESVVEHGLKTGQLEVIEDMVSHPKKSADIWSVLQRQNPFPQVGMPLLIKIIRQIPTTATSLDLSGFSLSDQQILTVLERCKIDDMQLLDLSYNSNISADAIRLVLGQRPNLQRLVLLGTSISNHDLSQLLSTKPSLFRTLEELVHPLLLTIKTETKLPSAFTFVGIDHNVFMKTSLPLFSPAAIIQNITDIMTIMVTNNAGIFYMNGWAAQATFSSSYLKEGRSWGERRVFCLPKFDLVQDPNVRTWVFALRWSYPSKPAYAFLSRDGPNGELLRYDLRGFLKAMEKEGRPPVAEDVVKGLESLLQEHAIKLRGKALFAFVYDALSSKSESAWW